MPTDLAVVVVSYNSAHVVEGLLDSLPIGLGDKKADVIVVDNGSSDGTQDLLEKRSDCRLVRSSNIGYAGGINLGVMEAEDSPAILVLNPDVRLHADSVTRMLDALEQPDTGIVAPQVRAGDGSLDRSLRREPSLPRTLGLTGTNHPVFAEYLTREEEYLEPRTVDWALGAVLLISRDCFIALGGWDESFFLYSEETDFCLRGRDMGFVTRYEPAAVVTHIGAQSGQGTKEHVMQTVNRIRLYRRRHGEIATWGYLILTALREITWIPRGNRSSAAAVSALFRPSLRAPELGCSDRIIPL